MAGTHLLYPLVGLLAVLVRIVPQLVGGGLGWYGRYDDGVYYSAAAALTAGRMPYRDFVLLHPPGIALLLAPFAELGRLVSDPVGMETARVAFVLLGGLNAVLVAMLARRWGWRAALAGGLAYACWDIAAYGEQTTMLEPAATTLLLVALLLLLRAGEPSLRRSLIAGAAIGLMLTFKIWYIMPWLVLVGWQLIQRRRAALPLVAAAVVAPAIVALPFLVAARMRMVDMVVVDQLLRPQSRHGAFSRLEGITGVRPLLHHAYAVPVTAVIGLIIMFALLRCWSAGARLLVVLYLVALAVLLEAPVYYRHYGQLVAAPAALVIGVGLGTPAKRWWPRLQPAVAVPVIAALALMSAGRIMSRSDGKYVDVAALRAAAPPGCVAADDDTILVLMNRLSSDLREGCWVGVDVTGITYGPLDRHNAAGKHLPRIHNPAWQHYLYEHLSSAPSYVIARPKGDGLAPATHRLLHRDQLLVKQPGVVLRASTGRSSGGAPTARSAPRRPAQPAGA
jgi:hypothetical protein